MAADGEPEKAPARTPGWQVFSVVAGVILTAVGVVVSITVQRQNHFDGIVERFEAGSSLASIAELGSEGQRGVQVLVRGIHAVPTDQEPAWPGRTKAILGELQKRKELLAAVQQDLQAPMQQNRAQLDALLGRLNDSEDGLSPDDETRLEQLTCIQLSLRKLADNPADPRWEQLYQRIEEYLHGPPNCT
jgi:hypothetical protein